MVYSWGVTIPFETIRFAAANRLCVDLSYQGSHRLIEPYSLRRTKDGNIILHTVGNDNGEAQTYQIDRIEGASATKIPFIPRYAVELTPVGYQSIASAARSKIVQTEIDEIHHEFGNAMKKLAE